jgi:hypothetical protein
MNLQSCGNSVQFGRLQRTLFVFFALVSWACAQTCLLKWTTDQGCLNAADLDGMTIAVPSNVTRLGPDGLTLCSMESSNFKVPAVLFVMDQSASMDSAYSRGGTTTPAGDPAHWRADLVRNAISYLYEITGGAGWFSYVEFADTVKSSLVPEHADCIDGWNKTASSLIAEGFMDLNAENAARWSSETGPVQNRCQTGTNYFAALDQAKRYIMDFDPGDIATNVAVIFISDGRPTRPKNDADSMALVPLAEDYAAVPGIFPPVHGIYLGADGTTDGDILATVSAQTGGAYNIVEPGNIDAMNTVMNDIIDLVTKFSVADSVVLTVNAASYLGTRKLWADGTSSVTFPQNIPLDLGNNKVSLKITFSDTAGIRRTKTTGFTIAVGEERAETGVHVINEFFNASCALENALTVNGWENPELAQGGGLAATPHISPTKDTKLEIELSSATYSGTQTQIRVASRRTKEVDSTTLNLDADGLFSGSESFALLFTNRLGRVPQAPLRDGKQSFAPFDTLDFRWRNPEDSRDTIVGSILLYEPARVFFSADTLPIDQIGVSVRDFAAGGVAVAVDFSWLDGTPVAEGFLQRDDSSAVFSSLSNLKDELESRRGKALVATYVDPVYGLEQKDTVVLIFDTPVLPVAWMLDSDGDGRAETLRMTYTGTPTKEQAFLDYELVWGDRDQDTIVFSMDSAHPLLAPADGSFSVDTAKSAAGVQWTIEFTEPLPFGHTCGSGLEGEGSLRLYGWFDGHKVTRVVSLTDKVGPVLTEMWVDVVAPYVSYFRVSEALGGARSDQWILSKHPDSEESERNAESTTVVDTTGIYTLTLVEDFTNRIVGGDSARFVSASRKGVYDLAGNVAHKENPYVLVKGKTGSQIAFEVDYVKDLLSNDAAIRLPATTVDTKSQFRVLSIDTLSGDLVELATGKTIDSRVVGSMPALLLDLDLPNVTGLDRNGVLYNDAYIDGKLVYETVVRVVADYYDQSGQFIGRKKAQIEVNDSTEKEGRSTGKYILLWEADSLKGLTSAAGRAVGNGVLLSKVTVFMTSTATMDVAIYDEQGVVSENSIKEGDAIVLRDNRFSRLGYMRQ